MTAPTPQAGGWVGDAMGLAYCMADALREKTYRLTSRSGLDPHGPQLTYDERSVQLLALLQKQAALTDRLAEALNALQNEKSGASRLSNASMASDDAIAVYTAHKKGTE